MFSMSRTLATALCLAVVLGNGSTVFAATAASGIDTGVGQTTLPFSITGTTLMTLQGGPSGAGLVFPYNTTLSSSGVLNFQTGIGTAIYIGTTPYLTVNSVSGAGAIGISGALTINGTGAALTVSGPATATNLTLGSAPTITSASAQTLANLQSVGACANGTSNTTASALAIAGVSGSGINTVVQFSCETIADITGVGKTTVPTCGAGNMLEFDGAKFTCAALPGCTVGSVYQGVDSTGAAVCAANPAPPTCTAGQVMTSNGTSFSCVANPAIPSCPANTVYQGLASNGAPICVAFPNCGPNQIVGTNSAGNTTCLDTPPSNGNGQALYVRNIVLQSSALYNTYLWRGVGGSPNAAGNAVTNGDATTLAKLSGLQQSGWAQCKISGDNDTHLNLTANAAGDGPAVSNSSCLQWLCAGLYQNAFTVTNREAGNAIFSQSNGVCNSVQAESANAGVPCEPPGYVDPSTEKSYPQGIMYLSLNCMYPQ